MAALPNIAISGADLTEAPETNSIRFQDGYTLDSRVGLNSIVRTYRVSWTAITRQQRTQLVNFFRQHAGVTRIQWTPPDESTSADWVCQTWTSTPLPGTSNYYNLSATFVERF